MYTRFILLKGLVVYIYQAEASQSVLIPNILGGDLCSGDYTTKIGERCATETNEIIRARTHDRSQPVPGMHGEPSKRIGRNIVTWNRVWIGNNAGIRECDTLGKDIIFAAQSAIIKSFDEHNVLAAVPASHL